MEPTPVSVPAATATEGEEEEELSSEVRDARAQPARPTPSPNTLGRKTTVVVGNECHAMAFFSGSSITAQNSLHVIDSPSGAASELSEAPQPYFHSSTWVEPAVDTPAANETTPQSVETKATPEARHRTSVPAEGDNAVHSTTNVAAASAAEENAAHTTVSEATAEVDHFAEFPDVPKTYPSPLPSAQSLLPKGSRDASGPKSAPGRVPFQVPTLLVVAAVMCGGVLLVGLAGLVPIFVLGFRDAAKAFNVVQNQATIGIVRDTSAMLGRIPSITQLLLVNYVTETDATVLNMSKLMNPTSMVVSFASVLYQPRYFNLLNALRFYTRWQSSSWSVGVGSTYHASRLVGYYLNNNDTEVRVAQIDPLTKNLTCPLNIVTRFPIDLEDFMASCGIIEPIVAPWVKSGRKHSPKRWVTKEIDRHFAYFDYILPVMLENNDMGFFESTVRSSTIVEAVQSYAHALRSRGRYMLVDNQTMRVVINSWNQSVEVLPGRDPFFRPFSVDAIEDPLMRAAVDHLRNISRTDGAGSADGAATPTFPILSAVRATSTYGFQSDGEAAHVRLSYMTDDAGLSIIFVSATVERDFLGRVYVARNTLGLVTAVAMAVIAFAGYKVASYMVKALDELNASLRSSSNFLFDGATAQGDFSHFTELLSIQVAYAQLEQLLLALKTVLPGPLLIPVGGDGEPQPQKPEDGAVSTTVEGDGDVRDRAAAAAWMSRKFRQDIRLNAEIFNEQLNAFQRKNCSLVWLCRYYTHDVNTFSLGEFFEKVCSTAMEFNGCLEFLRPDYVTISFGAHTRLPSHAKSACEFAQKVWQRVPASDRVQLTAIVDSTEFLVGTCGAVHGRKARCMCDVSHLHLLTNVLLRKGWTSVIVTQSTSSHLPDYQTVPVDRVKLEGYKMPFVLYELRSYQPEDNLEVAALIARAFRDGFHYMCQGWYRRALNMYRRIGKNDATARKLMRVCRSRINSGSSKRFMTMARRPQMILSSRIIENRNLLTLLLTENRYMAQLTYDGIHFRPGRVPPLALTAFAPSQARPRLPGTLDDATATQTLRRRLETSGQRNSSGAPGVSVAAGSLATTTTTTITTNGKPLPSVVGPEYGDDAAAAVAATTMATTTTGPAVVSEIGTKVEEEEEGSAGIGMMQVPSEGSEALFEWIPVASSSESDMGVDADGDDLMEGQSTEPMTFVDDSGRRWTRSLKCISTGAFSTVYLGMSEEGVQVAIKCIPRLRRDTYEEDLRTEMRTMAQLRHPNIVQYIGFSVTTGHFAIIMEYVPGGSLHTVNQTFGRLDIAIVRRFALDILKGLTYLHTNGIVHCDVKPHNMLFAMDGVCKLSDFGSTMTVTTEMARTAGNEELVVRGTALYTAPEVARGERCTEMSDIYSLGISLLELVMGRPPWRWSSTVAKGRTPDDLRVLLRNDARFMQSLGRGEVEPEIPEQLDRPMQTFVRACCALEAGQRPSAQRLMSYPFVL